MIKLFRCANIFIRLCESKQCRRTYNKESLNTLTGVNLFLKTNTLKKLYCTTAPLSNTTKDNTLENDGPNIEALSAGDPELEQKVKLIILETEVMRQEGRNVPSNLFLRQSHWQELLKLPTRTGRRKYLEFLFKLEKKKENIMFKKEQKRLEREQQPKPENAEDGHIIYSLSQNNIFLRFYETTINHFYNSKLIEAIMFGQQLVVDCGYDKNMSSRENINCAKQLTMLFADNRMHDDPFNLQFCNVNKESVLMKYLRKHIPTIDEPWFPLNMHEKSYCDIFPKEKLIYLTPHCREEMVKYDHDAVYIIGGIVDKTKNDPLSLAKAKKENIRMMKLPLDKYLQWGGGSGKSLTLNQVMCILLDVKKTGDWAYALRHVPRRKLVQLEENQYSNITKARTLAYDKDDDYSSFKYNRNTRNPPKKFTRDQSYDSRSTNFRVKSIFDIK